MFVRLVMPGILLSVCVVVHALAMTTVIRRLGRSRISTASRFLPTMWVLVRIALWLLFVHLFEIAVWAYFLASQLVFPDFKTALYFSAVTYTTVGYGDLVLPETWRMFAGVEGLTGILMCGWSTSVFYAVVSRIYSAHSVQTVETIAVERTDRH